MYDVFRYIYLNTLKWKCLLYLFIYIFLLKVELFKCVTTCHVRSINPYATAELNKRVLQYIRKIVEKQNLRDKDEAIRRSFRKINNYYYKAARALRCAY